MTTGIRCKAKSTCRGLATPNHPVCPRCLREKRLESMRQSPSAATRALGLVLSLVPHHDFELEAGG